LAGSNQQSEGDHKPSSRKVAPKTPVAT
jgi:hypothetical protein